MSPQSSLKPRSSADATRGRLLTLLRQGTWTVDDMASRLGLTDNAVRFHLAALERDGIVRKEGTRKRQGAGQPSALFVLAPGAEENFSRAYAPVFAACLEELREFMSTSELMAFLKRVGRRLARSVSRRGDSLPKRVAEASNFLNDLGGITSVERSGEGYRIIGRACPLSRAVDAEPCVCAAVTALIAEVVDANVREQCDRSGRPRCGFEITPRRVSSSAR